LRKATPEPAAGSNQRVAGDTGMTDHAGLPAENARIFLLGCLPKIGIVLA